MVSGVVTTKTNVGDVAPTYPTLFVTPHTPALVGRPYVGDGFWCGDHQNQRRGRSPDLPPLFVTPPVEDITPIYPRFL